VIGSNASYDPYLTTLSDRLGFTMVSVEYRLAPENPFPKPLHDCVDATLYSLTPEGQKMLGAPLKILGGESAGGWLAVSTGLSLKRDHGFYVRSILDAIVTGYGIYDMTYTPSLLEHTRDIILSKQGMMDFVEAGFAHIPQAERKDPLVSPLYADLKRMPPALFLTGAIEPLVDDSVFMAARWFSAGNQTELCVVEGACHAFTIIRMGEATDDGINRIVSFVEKYIGTAARQTS
jgi:acetyl esterase